MKPFQVPEVRSILFQDGQIVSRGRAFFEEGLCTFFPDNVGIVGLVLREPVTLKRLDDSTVLTIEHFEWHKGCEHGAGKISK